MEEKDGRVGGIACLAIEEVEAVDCDAVDFAFDGSQ